MFWGSLLLLLKLQAWSGGAVTLPWQYRRLWKRSILTDLPWILLEANSWGLLNLRDVCLGLSVPQSSEQNQDLLNTDRTWNPSERNSLHNISHDICISHKLSKVRHSQLNYRERRKASAPWQQYPVSHQLGAFCQHDTALWGRVSSIHPSYPTDWKTDIPWKTVNCKDFLYCPKNRPLHQRPLRIISSHFSKSLWYHTSQIKSYNSIKTLFKIPPKCFFFIPFL